MATMNIAGLTPVNDPAYRYKMPRLVGKVEGKGNGIKTVLMNVQEVSDALKRDAPEVTKFFGCELGAQTSYTTDNPPRAIVNGAHRDIDLQNHLSRYIENFVLCKNCHLPETHYKIKDGLICQKCLACGAKESVDMTHKLCTFILGSHKRAKEEKKAAEKKEKKEKKDEKRSHKGDKTDKGASKDTKDGKEGKEKKSDKSDKEKKDKKKHTHINTDTNESNGETVFGVNVKGDSDEEGSHSSGQDNDNAEDSDAKILEEGIEMFRTYLSSHPDATVKALAEELRNVQLVNSLKASARFLLFLGAAFPDDFISKNAVQTHSALLKALAPTDIQQRQLIAAFEWLCGRRHPASIRLFAKLLMQLYEEEIVEEDTFLAWAADTTRNEYTVDMSLIDFDALEALRDHAKPFVTWLQEAEEEGEEEAEEEESQDNA